MSEDEDIQPPPTSIEIGKLPFAANPEPEKENDSKATPEAKTETIPTSSEPDSKPVKVQPLSDDAKNAYATYIKIKEAKPSFRTAYAGIAVILGGFFIGIPFADDIETAIFFCFGSFCVGTILIGVGITELDRWKKQKKLKLEEALLKADIPDIPRKNRKVLAALLLMLGLFAIYLNEFLYDYYILEMLVFFLGLGLLLAGSIILVLMERQDNEAMKSRAAILEEKRNAE